MMVAPKSAYLDFFVCGWFFFIYFGALAWIASNKLWQNEEEDDALKFDAQRNVKSRSFNNIKLIERCLKKLKPAAAGCCCTMVYCFM